MGWAGRHIREGKHEPDSRLPISSSAQDEDPNIPKPVSFAVKETVCPKTTQQPLEQCGFKDNGVRLGALADAPQGTEQEASWDCFQPRG